MGRGGLAWLTPSIVLLAAMLCAGCRTSRPTPVKRPSITEAPLPASAVEEERSPADHSTSEPASNIAPASHAGPATEAPTFEAPPAEAAAVTPAIELSQPLELLPSVGDAAPSSDVVAIDLPTALALATGENPQVAFARQRVNEAIAQMRAAEVLWVPSLRGGMNYNKHEGTIQDVAGNIIETSRGSVYTGMGAQAVGAGSPAVPGLVMNFHTRDFIYQPRITEQVLAASRHASRATTNDALMETALVYNDLLEAMEVEAIAAQTLDNMQGLANVTGQYARTGQGLPSDADRAQAELSTRQVEAQRAIENVQVASVRLARQLSQDPTVKLTPTEPAIVPIDLAPMHCSLHELVATGLSHRPELVESRFLVGAAVERLRREQNAPLIPSVLLGMSYGGNGGGLGSDIGNFDDRMDFDAVAYWELRNLGYGEQAARSAARSQVEQARWRQVQVMDQVASEVAEAYAQVASRREQIALAQSGIAAAQASYRRNSDRVQDALGLPIEALQSIQALDSAQRQYVRAVADYNRAQFRLHRALGCPIR